MIHDIGENMTDENFPRLHAKRAGNKGVITKLIAEAEGILHGPYQLEEKLRNRLARIKKVLKEKTELIHDPDEKIIAVCKVVCYTAVFSVVTKRSSPQTAAENRIHSFPFVFVV